MASAAADETAITRLAPEIDIKAPDTNKLAANGVVGLLALASFTTLAILAIVLGLIISGGWEHLTWAFVSQPPRDGMMAGGIFPAIYGTLALVLLMTLAAVPLGVTTAVYLQEIADPRSPLVKLVRIGVRNLAGVPSIVFGLFGLGFFIQFVGGGIDTIFYGGQLTFGQPAILWASLTLALLTLPVVVVTTEDALRSVPQEWREASYALGATRITTIRKVVLPNAISGILTGVILAVSRGAGEVAPILFTGAAYFLPHLPTKATDQFMHLGYHVYIMATQSPDVDATKPILFSTVLVLLMLTFFLNAIGVVIRYRSRAGIR
jgi:phosphate transport system permease protein